MTGVERRPVPRAAGDVGPFGLPREGALWTAPLLTPEARAAELERAHREATGERRRDLLTAAVEGLVSLGVGLYLMGWSLHSTDPRLAPVAFLSGVLVGNAGLLATLVRAHERAVRRGDL